MASTPSPRLPIRLSTSGIWPRGRAIRTLQGHSQSVTAVAVTPDGQRAVSGSADQTLKVWDLAAGRELRTLEGHSRSVTEVAMTPNGQCAVSGSADQTLKVWDLASGAIVTQFTADAPLHAVAITPDRRMIIAGDSQGPRALSPRSRLGGLKPAAS